MTPDDDVVEVSVYIAAEPETVFPYFTDPGRREHHRKGWEQYLGRLDLRVRGGDPGPDPNA